MSQLPASSCSVFAALLSADKSNVFLLSGFAETNQVERLRRSTEGKDGEKQTRSFYLMENVRLWVKIC